MKDLEFRAVNKKTNEIEYIEDLYWFEENLVHVNGDNDWLIEQYTGLKDKNGVKIFEGDIVQFSDYSWISDYARKNPMICTYLPGGFCFYGANGTGYESAQDQANPIHYKLPCEKIGTIHD